MANLNLVNLGNIVNDGLGDDLRTAFQKVNSNFSALNAELTIAASNIGTGDGLFKQKTLNTLEFKSLVSGNKILLDNRIDSIVINSTQPDAFIRIDTNQGFVTAANNNVNLTLQGGENVIVTGGGSTITVDTRLPLVDIFSTADFGPISGGSFDNAIQFIFQTANFDFGTIIFDQSGNELSSSPLNVDFGPF